MPADDLNPAIAALERRLAEHERKTAELKSAINFLHVEAGLPPKFADGAASGGGVDSGAVLMQIKRDTFYGKKQMTAVREYLEMRRGQGDGPATPREIFEALRAGGHRFESKNDHVALVGLRAMMRKANKVFHKLPGIGSYGLLAWYPDAKHTAGDADEDDGGSAAKTKRKAKRHLKHKAKKATANAKNAQSTNASGSAEEVDEEDDA